jgi:hypothetical protein
MVILVGAHVIQDRILADKSFTLDEIAKLEDMVPSYATQLFLSRCWRLTSLAQFLAEDIRPN